MLTEQPQYRAVGQNGGLYVLQTDRFKAEQLSVTFRVPMTEENACLVPLMLSVLRRGTVRYPTLAAINRRLEELYGASLWVNCYPWRDELLFGFGADFVNKTYVREPDFDLTAGALELLGELLFHPLTDENGLLRPAGVEREKELQINEIRSIRNVPAQYAKVRAKQIFYAGTPAAIPVCGTEEEVRAVTPQRLTAFYRAFLRSLSPICFCVGKEDPDLLAARLTDLFSGFGDVKKTIQRAAVSGGWSFPSFEGVRREEESIRAGQGHLILCFRGGVSVADEAYPAMQVMNELLGGNSISKLFLQVRERKSLCYAVSSDYRGYRSSLFITCALAPRNRAVAEEEILRQVKAVRNGEISEEEMTAARKSLIAAYRQTEDRPAAMESFFLGRMLAGIPGTPADCIRALGAVTKEQVIAVAQGILLDTVYFLNGSGGEEEPDEDF